VRAEDSEERYWAAIPAPPRRHVPSWGPGAGNRAHRGYALLFLLMVGILLVGLLSGLSHAREDSHLLRQMAPRPNSGFGALLVPTAPPEPTPVPPTATAQPMPTPATTAGPTPAHEPLPPPSPPVGRLAASTVIVPAATTALASPTPLGGAANRATATIAPGSRFYEVEPGDTLFEIALANGMTVDAIMAANDITDRTEPLRVGRRLAIPPR
jgi:hypothetical protein